MTQKTNKQILGNKGEKVAINYLTKKGYTVQHTNYRIGRAEIDIIVTKNSDTVFVEVKTRSTIKFGYPEDFVSFKQQKTLIDAAEKFVNECVEITSIRFDVISVIIENNIVRVRHFEDAFWPLL